MSGGAAEQASVSAPAPKMGPVSDVEKAEIKRYWRSWKNGILLDAALRDSLPIDTYDLYAAAEYTLIRAIRAGVKLEDLL